jgi:flagellar assembly protein FliH
MTPPAPKSAEIRRFTFDTVFDGERVIVPSRPKRSFAPEEVEAIRAEAFALGERNAQAEAERHVAVALADVSGLIRQGLATLAAVAHEHRAGAAALAEAAARKIADAALERFPHAPLEAALQALAREVDAAPRLVVRCQAADPARLQADLARTAEAAGYPGVVSLKVEPGPPSAAFVLDWGEGRATFDPTGAAERIGAALAAALEAERLHAEPLALLGDAP